MASYGYQQIPASDDAPAPQPVAHDTATEGAGASHVEQLDSDDSYRPLRASLRTEFERPPPATWKRVLLVLAIIFMGWLAVKLGNMGSEKKPQIIYASRYSEEFKYRPAASPVITEYLKDGRIRLRGATYGGVGVREEDLPMTPQRKAKEENRRLEEAREEAHKKLGLKTAKQRREKRLQDSRKVRYPKGHPGRAQQDLDDAAAMRRKKRSKAEM